MSYTPPISGSTILTFDGAYTAPTSGSTIMTLGGSAGGDTVAIQATLPSFTMEAYSASYIVGTLPAMTMTANLIGNFMIAQLPALFLTVQAGYNFEYDSITMELPALTGVLYSGSRISFSMPKMLMSGTGSPGRVGSLAGTIPALSGVFYSGGFQFMTLPRISASLIGSSNNLAQISSQLPLFSFNGTINNVSPGSIVLALPMMKADINALTGEVGNLVGSLSSFNLQATGLSGGIGDLTGSLPTLKFRVTSIITGDNDLVMVLEPLTGTLHSGSIPSGVLRYNWERVT